MKRTASLLLCFAACGDSGEPDDDQRDTGAESPSEDAGTADASTQYDAGASPLDPSKIGAACSTNADCPGSTCGHSFPGNFSAPGGYCTVLGCKNNEACGGQECFGVSTQCGAVCTLDADCKRSGYACFLPPTAQRTVCTPTDVVDFYKR